MTRKDFELIARTIAMGDGRFKSHAQHAQFAADMAGALAVTNGLFDRDRFIRACMPRWVVGTRHENAWDRLIPN